MVEEKATEPVKATYDVKEASEDLSKIINETNIVKETTPATIETTPETTLLENILKEKVSFISEFLPGAELNIKTGELTAKAGNEWNIEVGKTIGWYVVNAYKEKTADGLGKEQDAIGLIPKVAKYEQEKLYEETGEYLLAFSH